MSVDTLCALEDVVCISVFHSHGVLSPITEAARTHVCFQAVNSSWSSRWNQTGLLPSEGHLEVKEEHHVSSLSSSWPLPPLTAPS